MLFTCPYCEKIANLLYLGNNLAECSNCGMILRTYTKCPKCEAEFRPFPLLMVECPKCGHYAHREEFEIVAH